MSKIKFDSLASYGDKCEIWTVMVGVIYPYLYIGTCLLQISVNRSSSNCNKLYTIQDI